MTTPNTIATRPSGQQAPGLAPSKVQSLHDYRRALRAGFTVAESIELARMMAQSRILGGAS